MKNGSKIYAFGMLVLFLAGQVAVFGFAWQSLWNVFFTLVGLVFSLVFASTVHELGHLAFAKSAKMKLRYLKFFCFSVLSENGKKKFRFASPFSADSTQIVPVSGGDMKKRASKYVLGGLAFSLLFLLLLVGAFVATFFLGWNVYAVLGAIPYATYLLLLNGAPFEYPSGKTDMLVYLGIKRGEDAETVMLACMEAQGQLFEGKRYSEVDEACIFKLPQLPEDEPMYAMNLFLRYRYYLDKGDEDDAADILNRLALSADYLTDEEEQTLAVELLYMNSLFENQSEADECGKLCKTALQAELPESKRALAAYSAAFGEKESAKLLIGQARALLACSDVKGEQKSELVLLERLEETFLREV